MVDRCNVDEIYDICYKEGWSEHVAGDGVAHAVHLEVGNKLPVGLAENVAALLELMPLPVMLLYSEASNTFS